MIGCRGALVAVVRRVVAHPGAVVAGALVLAALALGLAARDLRIDTSTTEMLAPDVPFRRHEAAFLEAFPDFHDTVVAVVEGEVPERVDLAADALAEALRTDPNYTAVDHPAGEAFFARHGLLYLDLDELTLLADRLVVAQPILAALAAESNLRGLVDLLELAAEHGESGPELEVLLAAMADAVDRQVAGEPGDVSWRRLLQGGETGPVRRIIVAQPVFDHGSLAPAKDAIDALREHARDIGIDLNHGLGLRLTGAAVLDLEELESVSEGAALAALLTTVSVTILLIWGLGSWRLILATLTTLAIGLVLTAGVATVAIGRLNLISVAFAVLFVGLGVDFGIHLVLRYREQLGQGGAAGQALEQAVVGVAGPLTLSALAAALGFLSFAPTDYRGLAELGVISASGMGIAWATSLTLLPALLQLLPLRKRALPAARPEQSLAPTHGPRPGRRRHPKLVLGIAIVGALAALPALPNLRFDFNPLNLKDPGSESMLTFALLASRVETSPHVIELLAPSLSQADALAERLEAAPQVARALTLSRFVPTDQNDKLALLEDLAFTIGSTIGGGSPGDLDPGERRGALERLRDLLSSTDLGESTNAAQRLAAALDRLAGADVSDQAIDELEQRLIGTLPDLLERLELALSADAVDLDELPEGIRSRWLDPAGRARVLVSPSAHITSNVELEDFTRAVLAIEPRATGTPVVVLEGGAAVVGAFRDASWIALAAITALLAVVLRNLGDLLLVLIPLALAALWTGAIAVLLGLSLNFANVIVLPLLLGLGVSGAIHVVMRWREENRSASIATTSTPRAVLFSALTTVASFGSLALSQHRGLASMGMLLTIAIVCSLLSTLVVLPSLLALLARRQVPAAPGRAHGP